MSVLKVKDALGNWIPIRTIIGSTPHLTIGTVTDGDTASATITGTDENPVLNLVIPGITAEEQEQLIEDILEEIDAGTIGYDDSETYDSGTVGDEIGNLKTILDSKLDSPSTAGTNGQVLTSDGNGGQSWGDPTGTVTDVQVNGTSVLSNGVANIPSADSGGYGVVKITPSYGVGIIGGSLAINGASSANIKAGNNSTRPVSPYRQHESAFYGLAKAAGDSTQSASSNSVGTYTETAKSKIHDMLDAPETVSGSTPSITAKPGVRYVCGEVSTLTVALPSSGDVEVIFESGSTATVLTLTPPSGVTSVKFPSWFDATDLEANCTYDIIITDGEYGVVTSWA